MRPPTVLFATAGVLPLFALLASAPLLAQADASQQTYNALTVGADARALASIAHTVHRRIDPVLSARGPKAQAAISALDPSAAKFTPTGESGGGVGYRALVYPADVHNLGGPTVASAQSHVIFMQQQGNGCAISTCWGDPERFLKDLGRSDFIHLTDQYVGETNDNRYTVGRGYQSLFQPQTQPFTEADVQAVVIQAAQESGQVGYGHIYHVLLPPGVDVCIDSTFTYCYSPDNAQVFDFCKFSASFDVPGLGHLLYAVVPYQNVQGCSVRSGTPNGSLIDSTNDALAHVTFDTIVNPDGNAWLEPSNGVFRGQMASACQFILFDFDTFQYWSDPSIWSVEGRIYATQPIYNNERHACTTAP